MSGPLSEAQKRLWLQAGDLLGALLVVPREMEQPVKPAMVAGGIGERSAVSGQEPLAVETVRVEAAIEAVQTAEAERVDAAIIEAQTAELARVEAAIIEVQTAELARVEAAIIEAQTAEPVKVEAAVVEVQTVEPVKVAAAVVEVQTDEPVKVDVAIVEPQTDDPVRAEAGVVEAQRVEPVGVEAGFVEAQTVEPVKVEAVTVEAQRVEPVRLETAIEVRTVEPVKVEAVTVEAQRVEPVREEAAVVEAQAAEPVGVAIEATIVEPPLTVEPEVVVSSADRIAAARAAFSLEAIGDSRADRFFQQIRWQRAENRPAAVTSAVVEAGLPSDVGSRAFFSSRVPWTGRGKLPHLNATPGMAPLRSLLAAATESALHAARRMVRGQQNREKVRDGSAAAFFQTLAWNRRNIPIAQ